MFDHCKLCHERECQCPVVSVHLSDVAAKTRLLPVFLSMLCRVCAGLPVRFAETEVRVSEAEQTVQIVVEAITGDAFVINSADLRLVEDPNDSGCLQPGQ